MFNRNMVKGKSINQFILTTEVFIFNWMLKEKKGYGVGICVRKVSFLGYSKKLNDNNVQNLSIRIVIKLVKKFIIFLSSFSTQRS